MAIPLPPVIQPATRTVAPKRRQLGKGSGKRIVLGVLGGGACGLAFFAYQLATGAYRSTTPHYAITAEGVVVTTGDLHFTMPDIPKVEPIAGLPDGLTGRSYSVVTDAASVEVRVAQGRASASFAGVHTFCDGALEILQQHIGAAPTSDSEQPVGELYRRVVRWVGPKGVVTTLCEGQGYTGVLVVGASVDPLDPTYRHVADSLTID